MPNSPTYSIHTMGCKLNFYDSEVIANGLENHGFKKSSDPYSSDLLLLNSCTVTNNSDSESRNLIRKFRRNNNNGFLVVTGCYAQAKKADISAMEEVDFVTTNVDKYDVNPIVRAFHGAAVHSSESHDIMEKRPAEFRILERFEAKTRAFIKIQDGCNLRCAYCIIPFVRGNNRSVPLENVVKQIKTLDSSGVREVVLTGIHIGTWGQDLQPKTTFTDLVHGLDQADHNLWIRISSLDSPEIPDKLIDLMKNSRKVVPHLHIPLQAGHNATLIRMGRGYTIEQFKDRVLKLKENMPEICIGADVIVGFPGETDEEFAGTEAFLNSIPMDYLHVFPYSNRSGTRASKMKEQINGRIIKNRARILREFSAIRRSQHIERHADTNRNAIIIRSKNKEAPYKALTDNYIECNLNHHALKDKIQEEQLELSGRRLEIRITVTGDATPVAEPIQLLD